MTGVKSRFGLDAAGHAPSRDRALEPVRCRCSTNMRCGAARARSAFGGSLCRQYRRLHRPHPARQVHRRRARHQGHGRGGATINQPIAPERSSTACTSACSPICKGASCSSRTSMPAPIRNTGCRCGWSPTAPGTACLRATCSSARRSPSWPTSSRPSRSCTRPNFRAIPELDGIRSETFIFVNFAERLVLIGGTRYAGEIKKSVFGYLNFVLPARGRAADALLGQCRAEGRQRDLFRPLGHRQDDLVGRRLAHPDRRRRAWLEPARASSISRAAATPR